MLVVSQHARYQRKAEGARAGGKPPALGVDLSEVPGRISHVPLQLTIPGDILTAVGLLLDAVGVVFLFWYAPEKVPDPQSTMSFAIEGDPRTRWRKDQRKRKVVAQISVGAIVLGFALQFISVVLY